MKKGLIIFIAFFLVISKLFGQESVLYSEIQHAKELKVEFRDVAIFKAVDSEETVLEKFIKPENVFFFENVLLNTDSIVDAKAINLILPIKSENKILELTEVPESFYNYEVVTSDGKIFSANRNIKHYRGIVRGEANSLAAVTLYEDEIMGFFTSNDGNFNIVKDRQSGKHLCYNDKNLKEKPSIECETKKNDDSFSYEPDDLFRQRSNVLEQNITSQQTINSSDKIVRLYFETEYDIYQSQGSISEVEAFIAGLFNQVAILYQNEDIVAAISQIFIWT